MQFFTTIIALFAAVAVAVPTGNEASLKEARALGTSIAERSVCTIACDVACNSTILALAQTKCLEICFGIQKSKC
ncbi:uncharacterized protein PAC_12122 [Phialocephala subalpina]|uniref:Extracellular membrane protein CFEM domain-containing protein n=1 Tax=Phialocephala subalpina TaxID=576137 RepID=A0A1L7XB36_9HELO|nr:uncharacterized protein PAC_12122 [Phialocephala subalpina]